MSHRAISHRLKTILTLGLLSVSILSSASIWSAPNHKMASSIKHGPGYRALEFELPAIGTYTRPKIGEASDGIVINSAGEETTLYNLMDDKITLLSFMYTSCGDINGCPLASHVLNKVMQRLVEHSRLSDRVQLLSFSFDRLRDSPEVLDIYASRFNAEKTENWQFVTAVNDFELERLLAEYNQFVIRDMNENGEYIGSISHLLRVYLIDPSKNLREVYSVSFLHPDIIINDISTILANDPQAK